MWMPYSLWPFALYIRARLMYVWGMYSMKVLICFSLARRYEKGTNVVFCENFPKCPIDIMRWDGLIPTREIASLPYKKSCQVVKELHVPPPRKKREIEKIHIMRWVETLPQSVEKNETFFLCCNNSSCALMCCFEELWLFPPWKTQSTSYLWQ